MSDELEMFLEDCDPSVIECNVCDCPVDTDIYETCPVCGNPV